MRAALPVSISAFVLAAAGVFAAACGTDDVSIPSPSASDAGADAHLTDGAVTTDGSVVTDSGPTTTLLSNGTACTAGTACASNNCVDGVCCDTTCTGTCESCNVANNVGTCTAIPDGTDPDAECGAVASDAGAPDFDGGYDASVPATTPSQCAGHCNGSRACAFAAQGTTCGTAYCGSNDAEGIAECDGNGRCLIESQECSTYACPDGSSGCKASCQADSDCLKPNYCNTATSTCVPTIADGQPCTSDDQCTTGACTTFYRDLDGDGYGAKKPAQANNGATQVCGTTAPTGYAATSDDCYDANNDVAKSVHPGQTDYFAVPYTTSAGGTPTFDYDCSGTIDKQTADDATCGFCNRELTPLIVIGPIPPVMLCRFDADCTATDEAPGHACGGAGNCTPDNTPAFATTVDCGDSDNTFTCTACTAADGAAVTVTSPKKTQQLCH